MNPSTKLRSTAVVAALTVAAASTWFATRSESTPRETQVSLPADASPAPPEGTIQPMGVTRLVRAIPFRLDESYTHYYRSDQPDITEGWIVVLGVSPELVRPTNDFQPVLYAGLPDGTQTLERINQGHLDGVSIAFLPGDIDDPRGLAETPIWFGAPELPERLTTPMIEAEAERIGSLKVFEVSAAALRTAEPAPDVLLLPDRTTLEETAAALIIQYAPSERDLAEGILIE